MSWIWRLKQNALDTLQNSAKLLMTAIKKEVHNFNDREGSESIAKVDFVSMYLLRSLVISLPLKRQKSLSTNPVYFAIIHYSSYPWPYVTLYFKWNKVFSTEFGNLAFQSVIHLLSLHSAHSPKTSWDGSVDHVIYIPLIDDVLAFVMDTNFGGETYRSKLSFFIA